MAASVTTNVSSEAQKLIDEMNKNSAAWGSSTAEQQAALHNKNASLASTLGTLGYQTGYDPNGTWNVSGSESNVTEGKKDAAQVAEEYKASSGDTVGSASGNLPSATDQSGYINKYYTAAQQSALNALDASYQQSLLGVDATAAKIPGTYYTAKNEAAVQNAQEKQGFNEYAAASGLNSGAGGQAQLAYSNQLQSNLSGIAQQQANAIADVELERAKIKAEYQSAVAQAIADNDLQKASALYDEMVRVNNSVVSTAQTQASLDANKEQTTYERDQAQTATEKADAEAAKAEAKGRVDDYLSAGGSVASLDPALVAASGYSDAELAAYEAYYAKAAASAAKSGSGSSGGAETGTEKLVAGLQANKGMEKSYLLGLGYTSAEADAILEEYNETSSGAGFSDYSSAVSYMQSQGVSGAMASGAMTSTEWRRHKSSGGGSYESSYDTYAEYLSDYVKYALSQAGK